MFGIRTKSKKPLGCVFTERFLRSGSRLQQCVNEFSNREIMFDTFISRVVFIPPFRDVNCQTLLCKRFDTKTSISCYALCGIEVSRQNSCARALRFCLYFVFQSFIAPLLMRFMCENLEKGFKPRKMQISKPGFKTSFYYF